MVIYIIVAGVIGIALGAFLVWMRYSLMLTTERAAHERDVMMERQLREQDQQNAEQAAVARAEAERRNEDRMKELMSVTVNGALERFATTSHEQLKANGAEFAAFNKKTLAEILEPLKGQLKEYDETLKQVQEKNAQQEASMKVHIESMQAAANKIGADAGKFVANLKCSNKFQGDFGENRLAAVLESVGMCQGADFELQSGENKKIPDCLVYDHIGKKICVIDSKMSWKDYDDAFATSDGEVRKESLKNHVASVRKQIKNLSEKKYHEVLSPMRKDYTYLPFSVMFVPSDGALMVALEQDPSIPVYAAQLDVLLASPLSLFGFLKLIEKGRPSYDVAKNIEKIVAEAKLVVDRIDNIFECLEGIEKNLKAAQKCLETAKDRASKEEEGYCIKGPANRLIKLGIKHEKAKSKAMATNDEE